MSAAMIILAVLGSLVLVVLLAWFVGMSTAVDRLKTAAFWFFALPAIALVALAALLRGKDSPRDADAPEDDL